MPTKVDHYALSLLNNLLSDIEEIRLSDQLRIVRLDKINDARGQSLLGPEAISESSQICERVTQLLQKTELVVEGLHIAEFRSVHGYPTHYRVREVSNHALEWQFVGEGEDPFEANYEHSKCVDAFSRALLAIRLLENPGFASRFPATHHVNTGGLIRIFEADSYYGREVPSNQLDTFVNLARSSSRVTNGLENRVRELFLAINNFNDIRVDIALNRFNRLWSRDDEIDKLIDLVVAFEAIYLGKGENTELKFKISARAARHIGRDKEDREKLFDTISLAYRIRSDLIHGTIDREACEKRCKENKWSSFLSFVSDLRKILAGGFRQLLLDETKESFNSDVHRKLDMALIAGS